MDKVTNISPPPKPAKKKKQRALTLRERKLIKVLPHVNSMSEAMRQAGYSAKTINTLGPHNWPLDKPQVMSAIQKAMEKQGITDERLASKISEGLDCKKIISANIIASNGEGMKDANSMTKDFIEVPDPATQHKYLHTALTLRSDYPSEKIEVEHTGIVEVLHIPIKGQGWVEDNTQKQGNNEGKTIDIPPLSR